MLIQSADDMEEVLDMSADHLAAPERRGTDGGGGNTDPVYPDFLGTVQPDPVCGTEAHPAGDCNYQALPSADGKKICRHSMSVWMIWSRN